MHTPITSRRKWTPEEMNYLLNSIGKIPMSEIYKKLQPRRSKMAVNLKIKRMRINHTGAVQPERVAKSIVVEMLNNQIGDARHFQPKRDFYERVKIPQKRFWQLYRADKNPTMQEVAALAKEWNITLEEIYSIRQTRMDF